MPDTRNISDGAEDAPDSRSPVSLRKTVRHFVSIARAFFGQSRQRRRARTYLAITLVLALAVGAVQVLMSYAGRDFMTAISDKDFAGYRKSLIWYLATFALAVPIGVY